MKTVILVGSSRNDGNTMQVVSALQNLTEYDAINLNDYEINHYDYRNANKNDDYLPLMRSLIEKYDTVIFATPVYWYAMSGIMKVFFDRFTDLLDLEKELGRKLRGKGMAAFSCSRGEHLGDSFWLPFRETANYLGMNYLGEVHIVERDMMNEKLKQFTDRIEEKHHDFKSQS